MKLFHSRNPENCFVVAETAEAAAKIAAEHFGWWIEDLDEATDCLDPSLDLDLYFEKLLAEVAFSEIPETATVEITFDQVPNAYSLFAWHREPDGTAFGTCSIPVSTILRNEEPGVFHVPRYYHYEVN